MAVSLAHRSHTLSIIKMLVCTCAMHMSSMDTSSITAQQGTVQYSTVEESRFLAILGFSKLLIIQTPDGCWVGGGGVVGWRLPLFQVTGMIEGFEIFGCGIFLVTKIWQVFFGVA